MHLPISPRGGPGRPQGFGGRTWPLTPFASDLTRGRGDDGAAAHAGHVQVAAELKGVPPLLRTGGGTGLVLGTQGDKGIRSTWMSNLGGPPPPPPHYTLPVTLQVTPPRPVPLTTPISWPPWPKAPAHLSSMHSANDSAIGNRSITLCYSLPVRRGARLRSSKLPQAQLRSIEGRVGVFE